MLSNETFFHSIDSTTWYEPGIKVLCACSGGIDSTVLLHLLTHIPEIQVEIIHFNHQLRGAHSIADMEFVKSLGLRYACPVHIVSEDIKTFADDHDLSVEEAGSQRRSAVFEEQMIASQCDVVLTAQHQDDQIETILLNLYIGTGIQGLGGIGINRGRFIRPLLNHSRFEIEAYASDNDLDYCIDKSNSDIKYLRNNIRHSLVPHLNLAGDCRNRDLLLTINAYSKELTESLLDSLEDIDYKEDNAVIEQKISLGLSELPNYFSPIQKVIFDRAFQSISLLPQGLSSKHFKALKSLLSLEAVGREIQLPASVLAYRDRQHITLILKTAYTWENTPVSEVSKMEYPFFNFKHKVMNVANSVKDAHYFWTPSENVAGYQIRRHCDGDKMLVDGHGKRITINQILQEAHIAPHLKPYFPVLVYEDEILWIPGIRTAFSAMLEMSKIKENEVRPCIIAQFQEGTFE